MFKPILTPRDIAERYHRCLPEHIRHHLKGRGIPATTIDRQLLGWNGQRITIPVFGRAGEVLSFRYVKSPEDLSDSPEMPSDEGSKPELYGWETLARLPFRVVICEGEFERLALEARGFPAVTSTAGVEVFLGEWTPYFEPINQVYICFNRSKASDEAAKNVQAMLPKARIAHLPPEVGTDGTITDFFLGLMKEERHFEIVLAGAEGGEEAGPGAVPEINVLRPVHKSLRRRAERLRKEIALHELVSQFTTLQASGRNLIGHCPLHDDRSLSFTVYLENETYRCSVCGAQGDVVTFVMDKESMTFGQALEALERFEFTHELYGAD
jgi:DNA primase